MKINSEATHSIIPEILINQTKEIAKNYDFEFNVVDAEIFTVMDTINLYFFKEEKAIYKISIDCINHDEEHIKRYVESISLAFEKAKKEFNGINRVDVVKGTNS